MSSTLKACTSDVRLSRTYDRTTTNSIRHPQSSRRPSGSPSTCVEDVGLTVPHAAAPSEDEQPVSANSRGLSKPTGGPISRGVGVVVVDLLGCCILVYGAPSVCHGAVVRRRYPGHGALHIKPCSPQWGSTDWLKGLKVCDASPGAAMAMCTFWCNKVSIQSLHLRMTITSLAVSCRQSYEAGLSICADWLTEQC